MIVKGKGISMKDIEIEGSHMIWCQFHVSNPACYVGELIVMANHGRELSSVSLIKPISQISLLTNYELALIGCVTDV